MSALRLPQIDEARAAQAFYAVCALGAAAGVAMAVWAWATRQTYWYDELFSLVAARGLLESPGAAMARLILPDVHPPLYYWLLAAWVWLFGNGELAVRGLSLLGCLGALGILWWKGRPMLSRPALALALLWLATNWLWVTHGAEARMYGLLICGGAWVSLTFARLWMAGPAPGAKSVWLLCLGGLPLAFLHYSGMALLCSALLLLLLRHPRHLPLWPPILAAGFPCAAWTAYHGLHLVTGVWIGDYLDGLHPALALPRALGTLFFPRYLHMDGNRLLFAEVAVWLALPSIYILAALVLWRQIRGAGGWRRWRAGAGVGDGHLLRSQLLLLGTFLLTMSAVHLWKPVLIYKALMAVQASLAVCVGHLGASIFARRHLALAGVSLALAAMSLGATFVSQKERWLSGVPYDGAGVREIVAREASSPTGARVFHWEGGLNLPMRSQGVRLLGGAPRGLLRTVGLQLYPMMADARHLIPPFYLVNVFALRGDYFRRAGLQVEYLSAPGPDSLPDPWSFASFLVTEPAS